jgi:hypothetical protein
MNVKESINQEECDSNESQHISHYYAAFDEEIKRNVSVKISYSRPKVEPAHFRYERCY